MIGVRFLAVAFCLAFVASTSVGAGQAIMNQSEVDSAAADLGRLEAEYGIRVDRVQLASAGYMVDFRYWVTDADKAWSLFRDSRRRELVHEASGARMIVPAPAYVGPMSQTSEKPKQDRRYYVFFGNPGKHVKIGDSVSIFIGDLEIGPLVVQ